MPDRGRDRGFTLIELLVVISIIGLLVALLSLRFKASGSGATGSMCLPYQDDRAGDPPHTESRGSFPGGYGKPYDASYLVQILPYIEQTPLYDSMNMANTGEIRPWRAWRTRPPF